MSCRVKCWWRMGNKGNRLFPQSGKPWSSCCSISWPVLGISILFGVLLCHFSWAWRSFPGKTNSWLAQIIRRPTHISKTKRVDLRGELQKCSSIPESKSTMASEVRRLKSRSTAVQDSEKLKDLRDLRDLAWLQTQVSSQKGCLKILRMNS